MSRTMRAILAVIFVGIIMFCAISICQNVGKRLRIDVTDCSLYTLSDGTKGILKKLNQPIKMKLYYTATAALKGPDQIRFFNNYYHFVRSLLAEYAGASNGMVELQVIDPRPFSNEEADALRYGLKRIPMSEEENFIFGLVLQTQFGVTKTIPFFAPERQNFVEYDISYLVDTAIRRQKKNIGILSSLAVMGEEVSGYMAQMMAMQGQRPKGAWTIVGQLRNKYEVTKIKTDVEEISGIDILLVIHPKDLPEKALFAVDQFVLRGGRTVVFIDPYCVSDAPDQRTRMTQPNYKNSSNLELLMQNWGLEMPVNTFAGDRKLALTASIRPSERPQKIIGFLGLTKEGFNQDNVITADLGQVRILFAGILRQIEAAEKHTLNLEHVPLISTTNRGNSWSVSSPFELMMPDAGRLREKFIDGVEPVRMGYLITGRFKSSFPNGIEITDESDPNAEPRKVTGLTEASGDCVVAVFSDVDFITDAIAYQNSFFGKVAVADNASLVLNMVDDMGGSADLISIRSRGNFRRPFAVVDRIEAEAEKSSAEEEKRINLEIRSFEQELYKILSSVKEGQEEVIGSSILQKKNELELKIHEARVRLREVKMQKREKIERLGNFLRNMNTLPGPVLILIVAVILSLRRSIKKRRYVSHASDA